MLRFRSDPQIKTYASVCPETTHRILNPAFFFWKPKKSKYADRQSLFTLSNFSSILVFKNTELLWTDNSDLNGTKGIHLFI